MPIDTSVDQEQLARAMAVYIRKRLIGLLNDLQEALPRGYLTVACLDHALREARQLHTEMFNGIPEWEEALHIVETAYDTFPKGQG